MTKTIKNSKLTQLLNERTRVTDISSTLLNIVMTNTLSTVLYRDVVPQEIAVSLLIVASLGNYL